MNVNREELVSCLQSVLPAVTSTDIVEQSVCFLFEKGLIRTYNDEISCSIPSPLKDVCGAVRAKGLVDLLSKMSEEEISVEQGVRGEGDCLFVVGKSKRATLTMEEGVVLAVENVETPKDWRSVPKDFMKAVGIIKGCAGYKDLSNPVLACIHLTPSCVEATDDFQLIRYKLDTGFSDSTLVRASSLGHVLDSGITELSETKSWIHFRSPKGFVYSCRRYKGEYPDLSSYLKISGVKITLPSDLKGAVERAKVFSTETESGLLLVEISEGRMKVKVSGGIGKYEERRKVDYKDKPVSFLITPSFLEELCGRTKECFVSSDKMQVKGDGFHYVTCVVRTNE